MLETCLAEVISEIAELLATRRRLEERGGKVASKIGVNANRLQVRSGRPTREMTMDDVEKSLLKQQGLLSSFAERVNRAIAQVDKEVAALESVRAKLEADLRDKVGGSGEEACGKGKAAVDMTLGYTCIVPYSLRCRLRLCV